MQLPFQKIPPSGYTRKYQYNLHSAPLSPQMKLFLSPFLWFLSLTLLSAALSQLSPHSATQTQTLPWPTSDDTWLNLSACLSPHSSLLPSWAFPAITSHDNTPSLDSTLLSFSLFFLAVCCMTTPFLNADSQTIFSIISQPWQTCIFSAVTVTKATFSQRCLFFSHAPFPFFFSFSFLIFWITLYPSLSSAPTLLSAMTALRLCLLRNFRVPHPLSTLTHPQMQTNGF